MELAIVFGLAAGITAMLALLFVQRKPETPAQARRRLYREAARRDREIHKRTWNAVQRHMNPNVKRPRYKANRARINRRLREMMEDEGYTPTHR